MITDGMVRAPNGGWIHPKDPGEPGGKLSAKRWSVTPNDCVVLRALAAGRRTIEIGTGVGISASALSEVCPSVVTIDVDDWVHEKIAPRLPDNVTCLRSVDAAEGRFGFAFIDGLHTAEAVARDIRSVLPLLEEHAIVALHDAEMTEVRAGILAACGESALVGLIGTEAGIAVLFRGGVR